MTVSLIGTQSTRVETIPLRIFIELQNRLKHSFVNYETLLF